MKARDPRQHPERTLPVRVIQKDVLPGIAPRRNVIEGARKFDVQRSSC